MIPIVADAEWDAGDMGCGELVLELRGKLRRMPGGIIRVVSRDRGAPEDIPAWCRMTENTLVRHDPETCAFWIRSRTQWA